MEYNIRTEPIYTLKYKNLTAGQPFLAVIPDPDGDNNVCIKTNEPNKCMDLGTGLLMFINNNDDVHEVKMKTLLDFFCKVI